MKDTALEPSVGFSILASQHERRKMMAEFYELKTANGHVVLNMDTVVRIVPHKGGSKIFLNSVFSETIISTESPSEIIKGLKA
jgi:hypothetical protein